MFRVMRSRLAWLMTVTAVLASLLFATPAYAITGGQPDNGAHPQTGLIIDWTTGGICSGVLIAPTVVLTAAHCVVTYSDPANVLVTFDDKYSDTGTFYTVSGWEAHPAYDDSVWPYTADVGVVYLAEAVPIAPASLPWEHNLLNTVIPERGASHQVFTDVGYGQAGVETGGGPPVASFPLERRVSWQKYHPGQNQMVGSMHGLDEYLLQLKASPSARHGSGCGGDSGGPIFLGDSTTVVAIHTGGTRVGYDSQLCGRVSSINHRIDTPLVLDWLNGILWG